MKNIVISFLLLAAFAAYVWVQLWCARWYDPWRDVSQAWCIVRDLSIPQIFAQLRYEGHPFLWYALLWPLAKLGLPFESILVLSTALMVGAAAVLVRFAPLPWYAKAACLFSVPFIYYLPTVARSYALAGLLAGSGVGLLILFRIHKNLKENLIIAAVIYFSGLAVGISFDLAGITL